MECEGVQQDPPAEVKLILEQYAEQGIRVRELKADKDTEKAKINEAVEELLRIKALIPEEWAPKPPQSSKSKTDKSAKKGANTAKERELKKQQKRLERERAAAAAKEKTQKGDAENYGIMPLPMSRNSDRKGRTWTRVVNLNESLIGSKVLIRGYVANMRAQGRSSFAVVRQGFSTVQCVANEKGMVKWCASSVNIESVVDIYGELVKTPIATRTTQSDVEIQIETFFVVSLASVSPPLNVDDCDHTIEKLKELEAKGASPIIAGQDIKLSHRHLSLRSPYQAAIVRVSSGVCGLFREFLSSNDFVEVQTPRLLGGTSEGGSEVFTTDYFGRPACLAQSPQLHKQILAACSGLERVFEIGPVFRAENSNTNRHLCEFHGLDMEMTFYEHYHEVLDVLTDMFHSIFSGLQTKFAKEIETIAAYSGSSPFVFELSPETLEKYGSSLKTVGKQTKTLCLAYKDAVALLREDGVSVEDFGDLDDMSTPVEKQLGKLVKEKYGVDWYIVDKFPLNIRPFYTMPCPEDSNYSNSYDFFMRGQEIMSGAQRQHSPSDLRKAIAAKDVSTESLKFYIDAFKDGAMPHGGGGIGLERVVMLFLGLSNIRDACLFVRDPQRLSP